MHKAMLIVLLILPLAVLPLIGMAAAQATTAPTTTVGQYDRLGIAIGAGLADWSIWIRCGTCNSRRR